MSKERNRPGRRTKGSVVFARAKVALLETPDYEPGWNMAIDLIDGGEGKAVEKEKQRREEEKNGTDIRGRS